VGFVVDNAALGQVFSPSTSVSPANYSTNFSIIIITRGWHNKPTGGGSAEWTAMWDFVMDKSGAGAGFLRELRFPLQNLHSICFSTIIFTITRGWHNRPGMAAVPIASQTK
jgi:hypothetical protein